MKIADKHDAMDARAQSIPWTNCYSGRKGARNWHLLGLVSSDGHVAAAVSRGLR